jgi:hypothetical protein
MKRIILVILCLSFYCTLSALGALDGVVEQWAFMHHYPPGEVIHCCTYQDDFSLSPRLVHCNFVDSHGAEESVFFQMSDGGWERAPEIVADIFDVDDSTMIDSSDFVFEDEMVE